MAARDHEPRHRPAHARLDAVELVEGAVRVVGALDEQRGRRDRLRVGLEAPGAEGGIQPDVAPAAEGGVGVVVVAGHARAQLALLELAARRADRLEVDVLDDDVRRHAAPGRSPRGGRRGRARSSRRRCGRRAAARGRRAGPAARAGRRAPPRGRTRACAGPRGGSERPWPKREKAITRRPVASCRACGKPRHSPTEPSPSCRSTSARRRAIAGQVGDLDREPVDRGHGAA